MATAANLPEAAGQAFTNLQAKWLTNTLKAALIAFWQATQATFPEQDLVGHPVSNWLTVISSIAEQMPVASVPYDQLVDAAQAVYRACWMTSYLAASGQITAAQATTGPNSILVQYNASF